MKYLKIFVGVKYEDKDEARKNGFRFDMEAKSWYKLFPVDDDATLNDYKPFRVDIIDESQIPKFISKSKTTKKTESEFIN